MSSASSEIAKLSPPDISVLVDRPRVRELLQQGVDGFTWVMGPAGGGKTSTVALWALQSEHCVVWYRVDEGDNDPASFFQALHRAMEKVVGTAASGLPVLNPEQLPQLLHFARRFFRAMFALVPAGSYFVFDNCHETAAQSPFATLLDLLLQERAKGCSVCATSREALPSVLERWLVQPRHSLLGWESLRCTDEELRQLCRDWHGGQPSHEQLQQAAGWPAGLALILLLQRTDARMELDPGRNAARVFSVLGAQAFNALPQVCQHILLAGALARHMTPDLVSTLCTEVGTPLSVAQVNDALRALWKSHFFVELAAAPSGDGTLYRFHPLLQAFLKERALREWPLPTQRAVWLAVGIWHAGRAEEVDAFECFTQAHAWERAAALFEVQAPALLRSGQFSVLTRWVHSFPPECIDSWPAVHYWKGMSLAQVQPDVARQALAHAHNLYLLKGDRESAILAACAVCDTYFMEWGDWRAMVPWVDTLWQLCSQQGHVYSSLAVEVRALSSGASIIFACPDHALIRHWLPRALGLLSQLPDPAERSALGRFAIGFLWWGGSPTLTRQLVEELSPLARASSASPAAAIELLVWCAVVRFCDANAVEGVALLDEADAIAQATGVPIFAFHIHLHRVMGAQMAGDVAAGEKSFAQLPGLLGSPGVGTGTRHLMGLTAPGMYLLRGQPQEALALARAAYEEFKDSGWMYGRQFVAIMYAEMLVLNKEYVSARPLLAQTLVFGTSMPSPYMLLMSHTMLAIADLAEGRRASGLEHLRQAMYIGRNQGFRCLHPWWIPALMAPLLATALEEEIESQYVCQLIRWNRLAPPDARGLCLAMWPYPLRVNVLGTFAVERDGKPIEMKGKTQQRVLALIKVLAAQGGAGVGVDTLTDVLWPDAEGDAAKAAFDVTLHRARKWLGVEDAMLLADGKLSFNPALVGLDLQHFLSTMEHIDSALHTPGVVPLTALQSFTKAITVFARREVLSGEPDAVWLSTLRKSLSQRTQHRVAALTEACRSAGAIHLVQQLIHANM